MDDWYTQYLQMRQAQQQQQAQLGMQQALGISPFEMQKLLGISQSPYPRPSEITPPITESTPPAPAPKPKLTAASIRTIAITDIKTGGRG